ncbi:hypothetical protein [Acinetobacter sp. AG3]|jgi:hypothetical protein|nr:hypothetical protein [Acinetobacter sp. AG3]MCG7220239.1 hypothetical protein [Acinetobacter sp. AG3]
MFRRIVIFLASLLFLLNSALVNASIGGWTLSNPTAVGASILYDGTKGSLTSSVLISPNASQVAKVLRGGVAGIALSFAVEQLLGAVDWVMDPANNLIRYKEKGQVGKSYIYFCTGSSADRCNSSNALMYRHADNADLIALCTSFGIQLGRVQNGQIAYLHADRYCVIHNSIFGKFDYLVEDKTKTLSLITVAQQVIENAESDNLDAQFTVLAAATNILSEAEQDDSKAKPIADELDNNSKCPSGIVRNGSCWVCDKSLFMPYTRATRDAKNATRGKSCKNVTDTTVKAANATLFRNLINARVQENACWLPPDPNHAIALIDAQNALSLCEN